MNIGANASNQTNNNPLLICGKIGNKEIVREDLNTFLSSIKDFEWTDNNIYKPAKVVDVKPLINLSKNNSYDRMNGYYQSKNVNFDVFYVEENSRLNDFQQYKLDIESRRTQMQDKILQKKKEFLNNFLPGENINESSEKKEIMETILNNRTKIIMNSDLNLKLAKFIGHLNSQKKY